MCIVATASKTAHMPRRDRLILAWASVVAFKDDSYGVDFFGVIIRLG